MQFCFVLSLSSFFSNCACMIQFLVLLQTTKHPKLMFYCIYPVVMLFSGLHPMGPGFSSVMVLPGFVGQHHGDSEMGLMTWYAGVKFLCILWKNYALILLIDRYVYFLLKLVNFFLNSMSY